MGTDIVMIAEQKIGSKWSRVWPSLAKCRWCTDGPCHRCKGSKLEMVPWYDERNYYTFSVLVGVRNCIPYPPISWLRGLPEDFEGKWDEDPNSTSWLYLEDILEYPHWQSLVPVEMYMTIDGYEAWEGRDRDKTVIPAQYSGLVTGGKVQIVPEDVAEKILKHRLEELIVCTLAGGVHYYVRAVRSYPLEILCSYFLTRMHQLNKRSGLKNQKRVIFAFD